MTNQFVSPDDPEHWSHFDHEELETLDAKLVERFGSRWGGMWIEPGEVLPTIGVAVVTPASEDLVWIEEHARAYGWQVTVCGTRYSEATLDRYIEQVASLLTTDFDAANGEPSIIGVGRAGSPPRVVVEFTRVDPALLARVLELAPADALSIRIMPGAVYRTL